MSPFLTTLYWIIVAMFYVLLCVAVWRVAVLCLNEQSGWNIRKIVHCLLPAPILARALDMTIFWNGGKYLTTPLSEQTVPQVVLGGLPGYLFFSTYCLLFCFWLVMYYRAYTNSRTIIKTVTKIYAVTNLVVYTVWISLIISMASSTTSGAVKVHTGEGIFASSLALVSAFGFCISGALVSNSFKKQSYISHYFLEISKKIGILAFTFTFIFVLRSVMILFDFFYPMIFHDSDASSGAANFHSQSSSDSSHFAFLLSTATPGSTNMVLSVSTIIFQTLCELIPSLLVLVVLRSSNERERYAEQDKSHSMSIGENKPLLQA
eukprot:TRINITY_DN2893_c0_g1_i1.p1 TRINITY_DN2893_c0_g1~~TRINITY_DN2893_c0_g1_i1.p1  ORF type:complete len:320 (+),score=61.46 TRINITY_DN2893_c0_g1_i1:32-991(+)